MIFRSGTRLPLLIVAVFALAACGTASSTGAATVTVTATPTVTSAPASTTPSTTTSSSSSSTSSSSPVSASPSSTASAASLSAFAGDWQGHTRYLQVTSTGVAKELVDDGCCTRIVQMTMRLSDPRKVGSALVATTTVVTATVGAGWK